VPGDDILAGIILHEAMPVPGIPGEKAIPMELISHPFFNFEEQQHAASGFCGLGTGVDRITFCRRRQNVISCSLSRRGNRAGVEKRPHELGG